MSKMKRIKSLEADAADLTMRYNDHQIRLGEMEKFFRHPLGVVERLAARVSTLESTTASCVRVGELEERVDCIERIANGNASGFVERLDALCNSGANLHRLLEALTLRLSALESSERADCDACGAPAELLPGTEYERLRRAALAVLPNLPEHYPEERAAANELRAALGIDGEVAS